MEKLANKNSSAKKPSNLIVCEPVVVNVRFEARKRPNLAKVGGTEHKEHKEHRANLKVGGAVAPPIVLETPPVIGTIC